MTTEATQGPMDLPVMPMLGRVLINGIPYMRPVIKVAVVTVDGAACTVPVGDLLALIDGGGEYTVEIKTMRLAEFERLPEFAGW